MNEQIKRQATEFVEGRIPLDVRTLVEATVEDAREAFSKASTLATKGAESWQQAILSSCAGAKEIGDKCLENAAANVEAAFEAARSIACSKTLPEASAAYTSFVRRQFAATTAQSRELYELSSNVVRKTAEGLQALAIPKPE